MSEIDREHTKRRLREREFRLEISSEGCEVQDYIVYLEERIGRLEERLDSYRDILKAIAPQYVT